MGTREATAAHGPVGQGGQRLSITAYAGAGPAAARPAGAALSEFGEALATASLDGLPGEAPGIPANAGSPVEATPVPRIPGAAPGGDSRRRRPASFTSAAPQQRSSALRLRARPTVRSSSASKISTATA